MCVVGEQSVMSGTLAHAHIDRHPFINRPRAHAHSHPRQCPSVVSIRTSVGAVNQRPGQQRHRRTALRRRRRRRFTCDERRSTRIPTRSLPVAGAAAAAATPVEPTRKQRESSTGESTIAQKKRRKRPTKHPSTEKMPTTWPAAAHASVAGLRCRMRFTDDRPRPRCSGLRHGQSRGSQTNRRRVNPPD